MQAFNGRDHLMARRCFFHGYSDFDWLFAFGQVRRPHRLAGVELVFQRDDFGSDVTTEAAVFWKTSLAAKAAIMSG